LGHGDAMSDKKIQSGDNQQQNDENAACFVVKIKREKDYIYYPGCVTVVQSVIKEIENQKQKQKQSGAEKHR
jgi:hypothetical protein